MNNTDLIRHLEEIVSPVHLVKRTGEFIYSSTESKSGNDLLFDEEKRYRLMCAVFACDGPLLLNKNCRYGGLLFPGGEYLLIGPVSWIKAGDSLPQLSERILSSEIPGAPSFARANEKESSEEEEDRSYMSLIELAKGKPFMGRKDMLHPVGKDADEAYKPLSEDCFDFDEEKESLQSEAGASFSDAVIEAKIQAVNVLLKTYNDVSLAESPDNVPIDAEELRNFLSNGVIASKKLALHEAFATESPHNSYSYELKHLQAVTDGDPDGAIAALRSPMNGEEGRMGFTPLRHAKNSAIINATLDARAAIKGGVRVETAYTTADYMILMSELCHTVEEAVRLREECTYTFADLVRQVKNKTRQKYSSMVQKILEEIERSIFTKVSREQLVQCVGRNEDYVQRVFKQEVGNSIMEHLRRERIRVAKDMMASSADIKISEMATTLQFSSTSHFARVFKQYAGMAPAEYKEKLYKDRMDGLN